MIITVTLNPALDKTLYIDGFSEGMVNRTSKMRMDIGGKGINVSKVLRNLGIKSVCTGFLGRNLKDYFIDGLNQISIDTNFTNVKDDTRTNIKIVDEQSGKNTDINESGPSVTEAELNEFTKTFENVCSKGDIVVLSGGVSPSVPKDIYRKLIELAKNKGAVTILDADGELLREGLNAKPDIIKPNEHELGALFNKEFESKEELIEAANKLREDKVSKILISMGASGALYITENGIYSVKGLKVPVKSTVGAGDSMVAAMVYSIINGYDDLETLKFATACGAATVTLEGTQACTLAQINDLLNKVEVKKEEEN